MGFGLVVIGYATLLLFRLLPVDLLGFFLLYLGLDRLERHEKAFRPAKYAAIGMFLESAVYAYRWLSAYSGLKSLPFFAPAADPRFLFWEEAAYHAGLLVFHLLLYRGVRAISAATSYEKGIRRARFGAVAAVVFYAAQLCATVIPNAAKYFAAPLVVFQLVWFGFTLLMLFGCYMMIVTDEMLKAEEEKYSAFLAKQKPKKANGSRTDSASAKRRGDAAATPAKPGGNARRFRVTQRGRDGGRDGDGKS